MADTAMYFCDKCNRTMRGTEFYGSNNLEKYPEGKLHQCKKCLTMHVDNWDPSTYMWILEECDVPYIPDEWNKLLQKYITEGKTITGATILGRYLAKMKLKQFKAYRFKDTEYLQQIADKKIEEIDSLIEEFKTKAFVKIDGDQVKVVVNSKKHDTSLANKIMRSIQSNYENKMYITVQFKA